MLNRLFAVACCSCLLAGCARGAGDGGAFAPQVEQPSLGTPLIVNPVKGSPIEHVIVIIQENRTMDNMFNEFPGADTVTSGKNSRGDKIALQPEGLEWPYDPDHSHTSLVKEYDGGAMNGFDKDACDSDPITPSGCVPPRNFTYSYVPPGEVTFLWILGGAFSSLGVGYAIADHMFSDRQVPSFPGHLGLIAGQGPADDPIGQGESGLSAIWGCDAPKGAKVGEFRSAYDDPLRYVYPCFNYNTIADLMDKKNLSWKYYTGAIGTVDGGIDAYDAIRHIRFCDCADWKSKIDTPMTDIFDDLQNGTLPQVSFITPPFAASDHGGSLTSGGPAWVTSIYAFLTENPKLYANTAIFVTWDDSGGWYDHVRPPSDKFGPLGFRVPLLVLSPFARQGLISHKTHSFGSILHFIEKNWKLGSLGQADASADDLSDMFDYTQKRIPPVVDFGSFHRSQIERKYSPAFWRSMATDQRPIDNE
jgi:phospholipase C